MVGNGPLIPRSGCERISPDPLSYGAEEGFDDISRSPVIKKKLSIAEGLDDISRSPVRKKIYSRRVG